jgi:hypothetical protein
MIATAAEMAGLEALHEAGEALARKRAGYPRVTEVIRPWVSFGGAPDEVVARAAARGTMIHEVCERFLKGGHVGEVSGEAARCVGILERWRAAAVEDVIDVERRLYDDEREFTGQIDIIVRFKGDKTLSVVDLKTSKAYGPHWRPQLAAYKSLALASGYDVGRVMSLRFGARGPIIDESTRTWDQDLNGFLSALGAYRYFKGIKERS